MGHPSLPHLYRQFLHPFTPAAVLGHILASPRTWLVVMGTLLAQQKLQISRLENPWAEVTSCESDWVSVALARGAGGEASVEVSTTSLSCSLELSGTLRRDVSHDSHSNYACVLFPLDFPLHTIIPKGEPGGWECSCGDTCRDCSWLDVRSTKKLSWERGSPIAPGTAELVSPCPLLTSVP